jgi:hypothetical protein
MIEKYIRNSNLFFNKKASIITGFFKAMSEQTVVGRSYLIYV